MKVVDVLRDDEIQFAYALQIDDGVMRHIGLAFGPILLGVFRRQSFVFACPHAIGTTKIRQSRVGTDSCAREHNKSVGFMHPLNQQLDSAVQPCHLFVTDAYSPRCQFGLPAGEDTRACHPQRAE